MAGTLITGLPPADAGGKQSLPGFGPEFASAFRTFCAQPANAELVEKTQRAEVRAVQRAKAEAEAARFRDVVLAADPEAQRAVAPFLSIPVLRRIVATLCNDTSGTFSERALNPTILARLHEARTALKEGRMTEAEAEHIMLAHAKDPVHNPEAAAFVASNKIVAVLDSAQLVGALNEALVERYAGNDAIRATPPRPADALAHYTKALAILNLVRGSTREDQAEVDRNKASTLWNAAAAHMSRCEYGAAVSRCTEALALEPTSCRVLLRRAKAHVKRGEWDAAAADVAAAKAAEPWSHEADDVEAQMKTERRRADASAASFAANAFLGRR